jgi:hypothetical protein
VKISEQFRQDASHDLQIFDSLKNYEGQLFSHLKRIQIFKKFILKKKKNLF